MKLRIPRLLVFLCLAAAVPAPAALILNSSAAITERVTVRPIIASNSDGSNTATFFGTSGQQASIFSLIDLIFSQAGIDVE